MWRANRAWALRGVWVHRFFSFFSAGIWNRAEGVGIFGGSGRWEVGSERRDEVCGGGGAWMGGLGLDVCVYGFRRDGEKRTKKVEV